MAGDECAERIFGATCETDAEARGALQRELRVVIGVGQLQLPRLQLVRVARDELVIVREPHVLRRPGRALRQLERAGLDLAAGHDALPPVIRRVAAIGGQIELAQTTRRGVLDPRTGEVRIAIGLAGEQRLRVRIIDLVVGATGGGRETQRDRPAKENKRTSHMRASKATAAPCLYRERSRS